MINQILFGIIGLLLLSVVGVGVVAVAKNPDEAASIIPEAVLVAGESFNDATETVSDMIALGSRDDDDEKEYEDEDEDEDDDDNGGQIENGTGSQTSGATPSGGTGGTTTGSTASTTFTMSEVAQHNSAASCYTAISGSVYDLTAWVGKHPGGEAAINSICGIDGTTAFGGQHGGESKPEKTLAGYKIGTLAPNTIPN